MNGEKRIGNVDERPRIRFRICLGIVGLSVSLFLVLRSLTTQGLPSVAVLFVLAVAVLAVNVLSDLVMTDVGRLRVMRKALKYDSAVVPIVLRWFNTPWMGDIEELYDEMVKERGVRPANQWLRQTLIREIPFAVVLSVRAAVSAFRTRSRA